MIIIKERFVKYGLMIGVILLISNCNYRPSSQKRFSNALDINIPDDFIVIKDEYQDMLQDFAIAYEIKLTDNAMPQLTKSIRMSKYYNPEAFVSDNITQEMYVEQGDMNAVWARTDSGYIFQNEMDGDFYSANIDTITMVAEFYESHD